MFIHIMLKIRCANDSQALLSYLNVTILDNVDLNTNWFGLCICRPSDYNVSIRL